MNKTLARIISIILITMIFISISMTCLALTPSELTGNTDVSGETEITNLGQSIIGILQTVGIVLSVVVLIIIGIKYMMGSAEEKAEYKKTMIPYIVGAALIFTASVFANVIYQFFNGIPNS